MAETESLKEQIRRELPEWLRTAVDGGTHIPYYPNL